MIRIVLTKNVRIQRQDYGAAYFFNSMISE